LLGSLKGCG